MLARLFWVGMFTMAWLVPGWVAPRTIDISDNHGGSVAAYSQRWKHLAAEGVHVRIVGACQSACTVLLGYIPREHICVMPAPASVSTWRTSRKCRPCSGMPTRPTSEAGSTAMVAWRPVSNGWVPPTPTVISTAAEGDGR